MANRGYPAFGYRDTAGKYLTPRVTTSRPSGFQGWGPKQGPSITPLRVGTHWIGDALNDQASYMARQKYLMDLRYYGRGDLKDYARQMFRKNNVPRYAGLSAKAARFIPVLGAAIGALDTYNVWMNLAAQMNFNHTGWTPIDAKCSNFPRTKASSSNYSCIIYTVEPSVWNPVNNFCYYWYKDPARTMIGALEWWGVDRFQRVAGALSAPAGQRPWAPARPAVPWPQLDPFSTPIGVPMPVPRPIPYRLLPYRVPNMFRSPTEQSNWGPRPSRVPMPSPGGVVITIPPGGVGGGAPVAPLPPVGRPARPGRRVRERKMILNARRGTPIMRLLNATTEGIDFLKSLYFALPREVRKENGRYSSPQEMVRSLYLHWDKLDYDKAVNNYLKNNAQDLFFGTIGRTMAKGRMKSWQRGYSHDGFGYQTGPAM